MQILGRDENLNKSVCSKSKIIQGMITKFKDLNVEFFFNLNENIYS